MTAIPLAGPAPGHGTAMVVLSMLSMLAAALLYISVFVLLPLGLAGVTQIRWWNRRRRSSSSRGNDNGTFDDYSSRSRNHCLCLGRVWHTRFLPKVHAFTYPIFMFAIDLSSSSSFDDTGKRKKNDENDEGADNDFNDVMWPLSYLVTFQPQIDHLKNGEGLDKNGEKLPETTDEATDASAAVRTSPSLQQRVFNLVSERTGRKFVPTSVTHHVVLLTHLCYYGYNFNPVSFYYVVRKTNRKNKTPKTKNNNYNNEDEDHDQQPVIVDAMVGEVSNTPWNEMYCYVLHPQSVDKVQVAKSRRDDQTNNTNYASDAATTTTSSESSGDEEINYIFRKSFHVSPFMEMDYLYDWSFISSPHGGITPDNNNNNVAEGESTPNYSVAPLPNNSILVLNSLKRPRKQQQQQRARRSNGGTNTSTNNTNSTNTNTKFDLAFRAKLELDCYPITSPLRVACQIIRFPIYCFIIQVWIHWEAIWLFVKGVVYVPHPDESETTVSKIIATIMIPFFAIRDTINPQSKAKMPKERMNKKKES